MNSEISERTNSLVAYVDSKDGEETSIETLSHVLAFLGGCQALVERGSRVLIKPNLVAPFPKATTSLLLIENIVRLVRDCGGEPIIAESSGFEFSTEKTFELLGARDLAKRLQVRLLNLDNEDYTRVRVPGSLVGEFLVSRPALEADLLINLPRLKRHSQTDVTIGIKNLFGLLKRDTRRKIHTFGLDKGIAELAKILQPKLTIVDASTLLSRAVFGPEENRGGIIAGSDVLAVDWFCCHYIGLDPESVGHIRCARELGVGKNDYRLVGDQPQCKAPQGSTFHGWKKVFHRAAYRAMYGADLIFSSLAKERTLLPYFHYYGGVRPIINRKLCDRCGKCKEVCAMDAVDLERKTITAQCRHLRCMKCSEVCPQDAVEMKRSRLFL